MQQPRVTVVFPAVTFALAGALLSGVLLGEYDAAQRGACGPGGCAEVLFNRWATFPPGAPDDVDAAGAPVALWGLMYFAMLALWLIVVGRPDPTQRLWHSLPMGFVSLGAVVSVAMLIGMGIGRTWCPLCLAVHVINLALAPYVFLCRPVQAPEDGERPVQLRPVMLGALLAAAGGAAAWFGWDIFHQRVEVPGAPARAITKATPAPPPVPDSPAAAEAPVDDALRDDQWIVDTTVNDPDTLVVFVDLHSTVCQTFVQRLFEEVAPTLSDRWRIAVKHYPQCAECNPGVADIHPWACESAYLAEAARAEGGAEAFLKATKGITPRRTQPWSDEDAIVLALDLGLNPQRFFDAWRSIDVRQRVARDIAEARSLGVMQTPAVFINGRQLDPRLRHQPQLWEQLAARTRNIGPPAVSASPRSNVGVRPAPHVAAPSTAGALPESSTARQPTAPATAHTQRAVPTNRPKIPPAEEPQELQLGDRPAIAGPLLGGGVFDADEHRGRPILLAFWASWCGHCREELAVIRDVYDRHRDRGLIVAGVSADRDADALRTFLDESPLPWPTIYFDEEDLRGFDNPLIRRHAIRSIPAIYLLDGEGKVVAVRPRGDATERAVAKLLGAAPGSAPAPTPTTVRTPSDTLRVDDKREPPPRASLDHVAAPVLAQAIIKRYDTNGDGILQASEYSSIPGDFARFDANRDGRLTSDELSAGIAVLQRQRAPLAAPRVSGAPR